MIVGTITKMYCESEDCSKEFSFKEYEDAGECCPFCSSDDGFSWTSDDAVEVTDDDDFDDDRECRCNATGCPECDERYYENYDCGLTSDGTCTKAGSEECDWECPYAN